MLKNVFLVYLHVSQVLVIYVKTYQEALFWCGGLS